MKLTEGVTNKTVELLVGALDRELELLDRRGGQMERLREAIVKADDATMEPLLAELAAGEVEQKQVDAELGRLRAAASLVLCPEGPVLKLSELAKCLPEEAWRQVERRRLAIVQKIRELRQRHMETAILLAECSRINRVLLETLLGSGRMVVTYDARGGHHRQTDARLLNAEL